MLTVALAALLVLLALSFVAFVLWPRHLAEVPPDAPSVPITVAGVAFNVPPAAIRMPMQRRPGAHERIDLVFLWPSLTPPDARGASAEKHPPSDEPHAIDRLFVTIAAGDGTLAPAERMRTIYPRYLNGDRLAIPGGLIVAPFGDATPYRDEDLVFDPAAPEKFLVRCSRSGAAATPGICLFEQRIGAANILVRFPRDWLDDWQAVAGGIDRLIADQRPPGR